MACRVPIPLARALVFGFVFLLPGRAGACATASSKPETADDYVAAENAVIIWDGARKTEHFIRVADVHTNEPDVGFLVPTPQTPELAEAYRRVFDLAYSVAQPHLVAFAIHKTPLEIFWFDLRGPLVLAAPFYETLGGVSLMSDDEPRILTQQDVGGYHAVTLDASNPAAVAGWLKANNYANTPQLADWLTPYAANHWKITAFKLIKGSTVNSLGSGSPIAMKAIRISFSTDRPFYPYSEPSDKQNASKASPLGRTLRVALLSSARMEGALADGSRWPAELLYSGPSTTNKADASPDSWLKMANLEGKMEVPANLTYWLDRSNPRPGTADLEFFAASDKSAFRADEIDYSKPTIHRIDPRNPWDDFAGVLIALCLPLVPAYCATRVIAPSRVSAAAQTWHAYTLPTLDRIFGFFAVVVGGFYAVSSLVIEYLFLTWRLNGFGYVLPGQAALHLSLIAALLCLAVVYCGILTFIGPSSVYNTQAKSRTQSGWRYAAAFAALIVAVVFAFAVTATFLFSFVD